MGILNDVTNAIGLTSDVGDGGSQGLSEAALKELRKVKTPNIKDMKRNYDMPKLLAAMKAMDLGPSAMEGIQYDPESMQVQREALRSLAERGQQGLTDEDKIVFNQLRDKAASDLQANQASMMQQQAQQGTGNSGNALMMQMMNQQQSAQGQMNNANQTALASIQAKRDALSKGADLGNQIGQADFARQSQVASARDIINQRNLENRQNIGNQNIGLKQTYADKRTDLRNTQQDINKDLYQQQFNNQMAKATGVSNQLNNQASAAQQRATAQAQAQNSMTSGLMQAGMSAAMFASDINAKENISKPSSTDLREQVREMLSKLDPYEYDYKNPEAHGEGRRTGIMAQDLEQSELGRELVSEDETGTKRVDMNKATSLNLAATSDIQDRLENLEQLLLSLSKGR
jgi:hypothetical protein